MSRLARTSGFVAFLALLTAGLMLQDDEATVTPTSFGVLPEGQRALYQLLRESGVGVGRSFAPPERLTPGHTVWWIEPKELGERRSEHGGSAEKRPLAGDALADWIGEGGTAVIWLAPKPSDEATLAGVGVPGRVFGSECGPSARRVPCKLRVEGGLVRAPRLLELPTSIAFAPDAEGWSSVADSGGKPLVLERELGAGRLVLVADARLANNAWLDRADAALLAIDLARAYGAPWIDEHEHGYAAPRGSARYLAGSPAVAFFVGLVLLALVFAWHGAALPARELKEIDPDAPTLATYVESMARLYAGTRDHARVLERYRELTARRLRRKLGLPPDASLERLVAGLARVRGVSPGALRLLRSGAPPRNAAELARSVAELDGLLAEGTA